MDENLTKKIQAYLEQEENKRDLKQGAELLLVLNGNRIMYQRIIRKPQTFAKKIEYELKKFLRIRLDHKTINDVVKMNRVVVPEAAEIIEEGEPIVDTDDDIPQEGEKAKGKREDHEQLPDEIKALWDESKSLWYNIKSLYNQLQQLEKALPCDRYEYLKQLDEADKKYRKNMALYDSYVITDEQEMATDNEVTEEQANENESGDDDAAAITKKVNAARKYLSDNKKKLAELKASDEAKYQTLLAKIQERYDFLVSTRNNVNEEQTAELEALGVKTSKDESTNQE
jgi:hypothetical protein